MFNPKLCTLRRSCFRVLRPDQADLLHRSQYGTFLPDADITLLSCMTWGSSYKPPGVPAVLKKAFESPRLEVPSLPPLPPQGLYQQVIFWGVQDVWFL